MLVVHQTRVNVFGLKQTLNILSQPQEDIFLLKKIETTILDFDVKID